MAKRAISPVRSQIFGVFVSAVLGFIVAVVVSKVLVNVLDFWYIGDVLGPAAGITLGAFAAFEMFTQRLRKVPLNWVGVSLFLGKPTRRIYENGDHWIFPSYSMQNVPARTLKYIIKMPEEKISAQDGALIYFGVSEESEKRNRVQYSVINPLAYIAANDPEDALREAYLEQARLFFSQAASPIGVKDEKTLFSDFVMLAPKADIDPVSTKARADFDTRLRTMEYLDTGVKKKSSERLFSDESVDTIMANAGEFRENAAHWGIGDILAFTPNVRANPETEDAAAKKQGEKEAAASLKTKAANVSRLAKQMHKDADVSPDLAATLVAALGGQQNVKVENTTWTLSGIPEVLRALGEKAIDALKEKK